MNASHTLQIATGGHRRVPADWVSATALRPLLLDDPALVWLKLHGARHGFQKDDGPYQFLDFIGDIGKRFESQWLAEVAPSAVFANAEDHDVRQADSVERTLRLMADRQPVIGKAALWWAPMGVYGTADVIALRSWLLARFPHLAEFVEGDGPDHYLALDCKFQTGLDTARKATTLRLDAAQVRLYSFMLGHLQGAMPTHAFLVCRDRPLDPLPVVVGCEVGDPLDEEIVDLLKSYRWIATHGGRVTPWDCPLVRPNFSNREDAPWSSAKNVIQTERWPYTPLETLPYVGVKQAEALGAKGIRSVQDLLATSGSEVDGILAAVPGIGAARRAILLTLLDANRAGKPTRLQWGAPPPRRRIELAVDFEFLSNLHVNPVRDWPYLSGRPMVFAIGAAYGKDGGLAPRTKTFYATAETPDAERAMWEEFLAFLADRGLRLHGGGTNSDEAAVYHWSAAEPAQARAAAERLGMPELARLPWVDVRAAWIGAGLALPGMWGYDLKSVAAAIGAWSTDHAVAYPDALASGMDAQVMAWRAYEQADPLDTREMALIDRYLRTDCLALWQALRWMRSEAGVPAVDSPHGPTGRSDGKGSPHRPTEGNDLELSNVRSSAAAPLMDWMDEREHAAG